MDGSWEFINHSDSCENWELGRAVSFLGIHKSDLLCSADKGLENLNIAHTFFFLGGGGPNFGACICVEYTALELVLLVYLLTLPRKAFPDL